MKVCLDPHSRRLQFLCSLYQLTQLIDEPTRITVISGTLIDLILTNRPENILLTGVIHLGISDHSLIYAVRKFKLPKSRPTIKEVRNFKHFCVDKFRADLHQAPWDMIFSFDDPNICWTLWKSFFHETLSKHAPLCQKRVRSNPVPWITPTIKQIMRNRDFHKKRAIKYNSSYNWQKYKNLRNIVNREMKLSKSQFYHSEIQTCAISGNIKKTWSVINSLTGKSKKTTSINEILVDNDNTTSDPKMIAESFNEYFVNIGSRLASEASKEFSENELTNNNNQPNIQTNSKFYFSQISIESVALTLRNLKTNKSTGLDKIPAKILKLSYDIIAPSLAFIFNLSLETGIYVDDWKRARVIPIYKAEDKRKCENYRPISILPVVSKVFEREVFNQVYRYLCDNSLLSRFQSGFRPKHSTLSALIQMCDDWLQNMDNGNLNCVVFLDVKKAFDSINHEILLNKMHEYFGISDTQLKWFESYLINREQQCMVNGQISSPKNITCGIPQGSILGPLLFLLYINDMPKSLKYVTPSMYADDTEIYASSKHGDELVANLNCDLENVRKWMVQNRLQIHPTKTKYMYIGSSYNIKNNISSNPILINNISVPRTENYTCLGVSLDERLTWEKHIDTICAKVGAGIGVMRRMKPFVPQETLKLIYEALVQPYFNYCSPLWDNCGIGLKDKLQKFQNRAARVITGSTYDIRSIDVLNTLGWKTLDQKRNYTKSMFMYKIINDHAAPNLRHSFRLYNEGDTIHDLRNHVTDLVLPKPKREFGKRSFKYNGAIHWNSLPYEAKNAKSISTFKRLINPQRVEDDSTSI